jgi:anti-sigma B factor antagonist
MFEITATDDGTIKLNGRFDASQVKAAEAVFSQVNDACVLDFADLSYISSAGLGLIFATQRRLYDAGKGFRLVNMNPHIREIFRIAGFDRIFEIE